MKKELLLILILFISMGYSVNAQRSLTNEYPYTEVLNCLSNPDTIFVCRIHNTAKTQYDIHELALFVYKQNGNWFASTLEKYDSSRKTHWILYDPIKVWGISFEMFADANNEARDYLSTFDWSSYYYCVYFKIANLIVEKEVPGEINEIQQNMPKVSRIFINTFFESHAFLREKRVKARFVLRH